MVPNGDPAAIFYSALTLLLQRVSRAQLGATDRPRAPGAAGRRHGTCRRPSSALSGSAMAAAARSLAPQEGAWRPASFNSTTSRAPFAAGGETIMENLGLRCRLHNAYEAEQDFGSRQPPLVREHRDEC